jgi:hypothetical protein
MNTIGKVMSTAILAGALTATSPGPLWAQATDTDNAPNENTAAARQPHAELVVLNENWSDARLYLVRGSTRTSLGFLTALGKREFKLPSWATAGRDVQILVHLIGGVSYLAPVFNVDPGDVVELVVRNNIALSSAVVFRAG